MACFNVGLATINFLGLPGKFGSLSSVINTKGPLGVLGLWQIYTVQRDYHYHGIGG